LVVAPSTITFDGSVQLDAWLFDGATRVRDVDVVSIHAYGSLGAQVGAQNAADSWCQNHAFCRDGGGVWVTEGAFSTDPTQGNSYHPFPGAPTVIVQNHCWYDTAYCYKDFAFLSKENGDPSTAGFGFLDGASNPRDRLCDLEAGFSGPYYPLTVTPPCPCSPGKPGCAGMP
jgi:hypothetical protein